MIVFQIAGLFTGEATFGVFTFAAMMVLAGLAYLVLRKNPVSDYANSVGMRGK